VYSATTNAEQPTINEIHLLMAIRNDPITEKITSHSRHQPEPVHMSTSRGRHQALHHPLTGMSCCSPVGFCCLHLFSSCRRRSTKVWQGATSSTKRRRNACSSVFVTHTSFPLLGVAQQTVCQGATSSTKRRRNACSSVFVTHTSFPLVGVAQQTVWQGATLSTSRKKRLFFSPCHPHLFSICRRRSTNCMAGSNVVYKSKKK
jgi:hypothetical protein